MRALRLVLLLTACCLVLPRVPAQPANPPLADLKAAAEAGNPVAQDKLGEIYNNRGDLENALTWYRRAAPQGILNSQFQLADILIGWANSPLVKSAARAAHADEAIPWLLKAASRGHKHAQLELGQVYQDGKFLAKDLPEAYKWFFLAGDGSTMDLFVGLGRFHRDGVILLMTQEQLAEGNRRIALFLASPGAPNPVPEPSYFSQLRLQGITGPPSHALAIINGRSLATNESASLKIESRSLTVRCLNISSNSAVISIEGFPEPKELVLR